MQILSENFSFQLLKSKLYFFFVGRWCWVRYCSAPWSQYHMISNLTFWSNIHNSNLKFAMVSNYLFLSYCYLIWLIYILHISHLFSLIWNTFISISKPKNISFVTDHGVPPASSPTKIHATKWMKRGFRPFSSTSFQRYHHERSKINHIAPTPLYQLQPPTYAPQG